MNKIVSSVILPTFNCQSYINDAINSILQQTYSNFELIIVDDYSTDNTKSIVNNYKLRDKRISLYSNKTNKGLPYTLNKAISYSRGKYIFRMDADDVSCPNRLEIQIKYMEENPEIFLCGTGAYIINHSGKKINQFIPKGGIIDSKDLLDKNQFYHPTICFRNIGRVKYREKFTFAQDYDLYLRLLRKGLILSNLKEPLINYRVWHTENRPQKIAKQYLFAQEAIKSYHSVINNEVDTYSELDQEKILNYDFDHTHDTKIISILIHENMKAGNRALAKKYLKKLYSLSGLNSNLLRLLLIFLFRKPIIFIYKFLINLIDDKPNY